MPKIDWSNSPAHFFLLIALFFGTVYGCLVPPFQAPDEVNHFLRAYHLSEGHAFGEKMDARFGGYLPESLAKVAQVFRPLRYNYEARTSPSEILKTLQIPLQPEQRTFLDFPNVAYYSPTAYVPQPPVLFLLRKLNLPPLWMLYIGRWITLLFWAIVVFFAIKIIPFGKWTLAFLALLPSSLFLHASLTADATTNALAFLLLARLINLAFAKTKLTTLNLLLVTGISLLITVNKVVYSPLVLLLWLIPVSMYRSRSNYWLVNAGILLLHGLLLWWWYQQAGQLFVPYDEYNPAFRDDQQLNPGVQPQAQLHFILENPIAFFKILLQSYAESSRATLAHFLGKFGWEHNYLPLPMLLLLLVTLLAQALTEQQPNIRLQARHRLWFVGTALAMTLAFSVVIYMQWSPPGHDRIRALAGRYFIPIVPLLLLTLKNERLQLSKKWWQWSRLAVFVVAQAVGIWMVWERYFV